MKHTTEPTNCNQSKWARLRRREILLALPVLALAITAGAAPAAKEIPASPDTLRVGISPVFPPMVFKQGKVLAGVEIDLARALGEKLNRTVVFVELDWKDQTEALNNNQIDIIMSSMSVTPARKAIINFTQPYLKVGQMALVRREDRHKHPLGLSISTDTKIAVLKATTGDFLVQREYPRAKRKTFATEAEAAKAVIRGSADMFIGDSTLVWHLAGTHANDGLAVVQFLLSEELLAWGVRRGNDDLLLQANQFITQAAQDGTFKKVFRRWMAVE
jgi:polar amino acid transport system substrate-binding protein